MPFLSKTGVNASASLPDDRKTIQRLLNAAKTGLDVAFRSLTLDTLLVRGIATFGQFRATTATVGTLTGGSRGAVAYLRVTSSQGPTAPPFDITGLAATATLIAGRNYRISAQTLITSSTATDAIQLGIFEDGTAIQLTNETQPGAGAVSGSNRASVIRRCTTDVAAGSHTYKLTAQRNGGGAGNFTNNAGTTFPSYILIEDIGP